MGYPRTESLDLIVISGILSLFADPRIELPWRTDLSAKVVFASEFIYCNYSLKVALQQY